ncbi:putative uncharacterized protein CXorf58 homolog isoform X1 [Mastomys coucha]|uniref:putative uncharacterized protein CXorf58 homolog isoform X1 n=1 Tax=Mastomys coucha TaxID=35658 RepID=UPI0012629503|nr:putative uncharacterized protein CXorf58 homolog isoform X1 [Mastomys coucha]
MDTSSDKTMENQKVQNQRKPAGQRWPPPEENPRVKCRDCGAFGHTVRSRKCPIKCWDGAKTPQLLGVKKEKENQDPQKKPQNPQNPEPEHETEKEREERETLEKKKKALMLRFPKKPPEKKPQSWKDTTNSGDYLRRPSRPTFVHVSRKLSLSHSQVSVPADEKSDGQQCHTAPSTEDPDMIVPLEEEYQTWDVPSVSTTTTTGHSDEDPELSDDPTDQSTEYCFYQVPEAAFQEQEMGHMFNTLSAAQQADEDKHSHLYSAAHTESQGAELSFKVTTKRNFQIHTQIIQNSTKKFRLSYQTHKKSTKRPMLGASHPLPCSSTSRVEPKGLPQGISVEQQPPHNKALLNFTQPCTESHHPLASHIPVQSLRMVFTRLGNGCWSSRILEASSFHVTEKKITPIKITLSLKRSGGQSSWVFHK